MMKILKIALITAPTLQIINYEKEIEEIIYTINANNKKWKEILIQVERNGKHHHIICFKSDL